MTRRKASRYEQDTSRRKAIFKGALKGVQSPYVVKYNILMATLKSPSVCLCVCVCLRVLAYDFEWSNLADERVAIVRGIIWLLLLR